MANATLTPPDRDQRPGETYDHPGIYDDASLRDLEQQATTPSVADEAEDYLKSQQPQDDTVGKGYNLGKAVQEGRSKAAGIFGKRAALIGVAGLALVMPVLIIAFLLMMIAPYKEVHFATILRSTGFATYLATNKKFFSRTIFDAAVLTNTSTGTKDPVRGNLLDRLRGVNPDKALAALGREGTLKFQFDADKKWGGLSSTNAFKGVELNGKVYSLDAYAAKASGKPFNQLNSLQKLSVKYAFLSDVTTGLADRLAVESRSFNTSTYKGLRSTLGLKKYKWINKAKAYKDYAIKDAFKENMKSLIDRINGRAGGITSMSSDLDKEAKDLANQTIDDALAGKEPSTKPGEIRSRWAKKIATVSKVSDVVMVTTVACMVHDLSNSFDEIDRQQDTKAITQAHDSQTTMDQIISGDTVDPAVGGDTMRLSSAYKDGTGSADGSTLYRLSTRQEVSQKDLGQLKNVPSIDPASKYRDIIQTTDKFLFDSPIQDIMNPIAPLIKIIPGAKDKINDESCKLLLNSAVQLSIAGGELIVTVVSGGTTKGAIEGIKLAVTGLLKIGASMGVGELLGSFIDSALKDYSGTNFSGASRGSGLYDELYVGTKRMAMVGMQQTLFGRPGTSKEYNQGQAVAMNEIWQENNKKPFSERYFALSNPYSLASKLAAALPSNFSSIALSLRQGLASFSSIITMHMPSYVSSILSGRVSAAAAMPTIDDGVDIWVWSQDELNKLNNDPSFDVVANNNYVIPKLDALNAKYAKCYTYYLQIDKPKDDPITGRNDCSMESLSSNEALHWRWFMAEGNQAEISSSKNLTGAPSILEAMGASGAN